MPPDPAPSPSDEPHAMDRAALLAALRARLRRAGPAPREAVPLSGAIDAALPGRGLARAGLHEVLAAGAEDAAGFCAMVLGRSGGSVAWIGAGPADLPASPARFGLSPAQLLLVGAPRAEDALWAMEEALRCPGITGALLVAAELEEAAARRLQLAAEAGGALGLLLRPAEAGPTGAALTRWRLAGLGEARWGLELLRCRGGAPAAWTVTWRATLDRLDTEGAEAPPANGRAVRRRPA